MTGSALRADVTPAYLSHVLAQVPRLLGQWDRSAVSPTAGSFDREWWAWKFRDSPITMLQAGMLPLATLWAHPFPDSPYFQNGPLSEWIQSGVEHSLARQRPNGAFDSVGPNTQDHGVTLAMAFILGRCLSRTGQAWTESLRSRVIEAIRRAAGFAERSAEDYAFVSNHHALFALSWLETGTLTGERSFRDHADREVAAILAHQSADGWYSEYGGADPGYESLGLHYLAQVWRQNRSADLLSSLRRSVEFFSHAVHPDGSVGGVYGSRGTVLYMPAGLEHLAAEDPVAGRIAAFMRERLSRGNVVTPATADAMNLPIVMASYLEACFGAAPPAASSRPLPCEESTGFRRFPDSGFVASSTARYYAVFAPARGGVIRVFDRAHGRIAYEDAGYVAVTDQGARWTSQSPSATATADQDEATCVASFTRYDPVVVTPWKFVLLRFAQLTVFRNVALGMWIRRRIVERLITKREIVPLKLSRRVRFGPEGVEVHDQLKRDSPVTLRSLELLRTFTPWHMGSARYFSESELVETVTAPAVPLAEGINRDGQAERRFAVVFRDAGVRVERQ